MNPKKLTQKGNHDKPKNSYVKDIYIETSDNCNNDIVEYLTPEELSTYITLSDEEKKAIELQKNTFPLKITRYYAELIKGSMPDDPLRKLVIPRLDELKVYEDDTDSNVHADEANYQPVEGIIHRYYGKVLFFPTLKCFSYCRFCFRSEGRVNPLLDDEKLEAAFDYISRTKEIRDVIITGGDPLTLPLNRLDFILRRIRSIDHVEILRIGTRALAYAPQVITQDFVNMLKTYRPIFMKCSFMHSREITDYCAEKLNMLADAGIVLLQQGPLLKGVNDSVCVLKELYEKLAKNRVIPYYAIYDIHSPGTRHFNIIYEHAKTLVNSLENKTSGFCIPTLITLDESNDKTRKIN